MGMRYLDSGSRQPSDALGSWLKSHVSDECGIREVRWQTGYFDSGVLPFVAPALDRASTHGGRVHLLVGSNQGMTRSADIQRLMSLAGPPRPELSVGVVSYAAGLFHPKVVHVVRADGTMAAYVGSANLTRNGVTSVNVEAGITVDSRDGDDRGVLRGIGERIDWWFDGDRHGLTVISKPADLVELSRRGILDQPPTSPGPGIRPRSPGRHGARLRGLIDIPALFTPRSGPFGVMVATWSKKLTRSDAQRKLAGNQRGSITLVQAGYDIDAQSYFRWDLFSAATWRSGFTQTGKPIDEAWIQFSVTFLGRVLGPLTLRVTYDPEREASQANYTSLLHLDELSDLFRTYDLTGRHLTIARDNAGKFALSIG